ncbi:type IX secretion/gliding motility protein PorT/SprT [Sporocytophaga myxococcoides]|nr:outer membrane beta-barrel protein [Sporocytophaga myxococcoides]
MSIFKFRNSLHLRGKKTIALFFCLFTLSKSFGQYTANTNLPFYDDKLLHYGFFLAAGMTKFNVVHSDYYFQLDSIRQAAPGNNGALTIGFIVNLKLHDHWDLRLLPNFSLYTRNVVYQFQNKYKSDQITESSYINLPLLVKFKSQRRKNARMYILGGINPGIEAGAKKKEKKETDLRVQNTDLRIDYGFGFDIYYPLFKFSPELRFSHGVKNMLINDDNIYSKSLKKVFTHTVTLYLNFE